MRILTDLQEELLKQERRLLNNLQIALLKFDASTEDQGTLKGSLEQLDEFFSLVVVGEFNAGKSAFINALIGQELLKQGVTPTTMQINILRYGKEQTRTVVNENLHILSAPVDFLEEVSIVDTPGTNAIIRKHELITTRFVPRADLVLFITSADRPFTESERAFLEQIRDWGKKIVVAVNKIDILGTKQELEEVRSFVSENVNKLLSITPEVFLISARLALRAKNGEPNLWVESRFGLLEEYIRSILEEGSRLRLKFYNPLGVGTFLCDRYLGVIEKRQSILRDDFIMLSEVDDQLLLYKQDMERDFKMRIADVENILYEVEQRGGDYFDETIQLVNIFDLLDKEKMKRGFETRVMSDVAERIDQKVNDLIDWIVDCNLRQWQAVTEHLAERRREHKQHIIGDIGTFSYDRERMIEGVGRETQRVVEDYDKEKEAAALAEGTIGAVAAVAAVEIGAVGLGTAVVMAATTAAMDFTGILLASIIAALGLFIIPARRRQAKQELRDRMTAMREQLALSLGNHFDHELERSLQNIREAIAPYTRFVRAEGDKLNGSKEDIVQIKNGLDGLKVKVEEL